MVLLPVIILGVIVSLGIGIDMVSKKRKSKSTSENLTNSAIQKDWYKPSNLIS